MSLFQFADSSGPTYDPEMVQPMRDELVAVGIKELLTSEDVEESVGKEGTLLVIVNSVCGCAAGNARPGVMLALQNKVIPDQYATVFAGQEKAAAARAREFMSPYPPSSPCIALFKDGKVVHILQRPDIEDRSAQMVAQSLVEAFDQHCAKAGPSIPPEELQKIPIIKMCGSSIPLASP